MRYLFKNLFEYNHYCNQQLIEKITANSEKVSEKTIELQNHIINAHQIWNSRILNKTPFGVFQVHTISDLQNLDQRNHKDSLEIIQNQELLEVFEYKNTKGETFYNSVRDILFHVINHSTYHRAQIATEFKTKGIPPLVTDYIFYRRDQKTN